jgi:hypothetical protein
LPMPPHFEVPLDSLVRGEPHRQTFANVDFSCFLRPSEQFM